MADDVEELRRGLDLPDAVVMGWSFGTFVAQAHMIRHGSAAGYVLMATVAEPGALHLIQGELAAFQPEHCASRWRTPGRARYQSKRPRRRDSFSPTSTRSMSLIPKARWCVG
jgi:pimeloyl-ACP methyl ester carboxylesterase